MKLPPQHGIAGRYAAALYMAAVKSDTLSKVESELSGVAQLMSESKDFSTFITDPSVPRNTKLDGLDAVLSKMGASEITKNFVGAWRWGWGDIGGREVGRAGRQLIRAGWSSSSSSTAGGRSWQRGRCQAQMRSEILLLGVLLRSRWADAGAAMHCLQVPIASCFGSCASAAAALSLAPADVCAVWRPGPPRRPAVGQQPSGGAGQDCVQV